MSGGGNIKVVVRCRPLNAREKARGAKSLIRMEGNQTILDPPEVQAASARATERKPQVFSFDKSYWSASSKDDPRYASQQTLFNDLGVELLNHSFEGFNTCIFAYGQTGSGKSYSMMGYGLDKGIIPLSTGELFRRVEEQAAKDENLSFSIEVSFMEIYNEKVRDLLNPKNKGNLRVREHPSLGPYVEDLSKLVVENDAQMTTLMDEGNKARTVASTNMNETSSRSHSVFTIILTQKRKDPATKMVGEKVSKISLVDLAGSERQASTGATGTRLKEGANINKSLTTLGKVIAALASAGESSGGGGGKRRKKEEFVPYRDSVLTWLLKESLGGNSKTAMIAAISPADYDETLSTLRYADAAKRIRTNAVVNEDPNAKLIRELKEELEMLRGKVASGASEGTYDASIPPEKQIVTYQTKDGEIKRVTKLELQDQLQASEKLMEDLNLTWEEKMAATAAIHVAREKALEELGITVDKDMVGVHAPQKFPSLVNLNEDPLMSECLIYQLKPGTTVVGNVESTSTQIKLSGEHIKAEHCRFTNADGHVTLDTYNDARTFVNGKRVPPKTPVKLQHGFRVILGDFHVFRFNDPAGVRAHRTRMSGMWGNGTNGEPMLPGAPSGGRDSPAPTELMDWTAARREAADIEALGDRDLDKLFDDIVKVRTLRGRPDSRLDLAADLESRIKTSIAGDSVDMNPWENQFGNGSPMGQEGGVDQTTDGTESTSRSETPGARLSMSNVSGVTGSTEDSVLEHQYMTKLRMMAQEVKRIRAQAAVAKARGVSVAEEEWTMAQTVLARRALEKWKQLRNFAMAEQMLNLAGDVREANIIARLMGRRISYNFAIMDGSAVGATSALDDLGGIIEFDDVTDSSVSPSGPRIMIKVIDHESTSVYTWNTGRFQQQLARMRQVLAVKDKPNYSIHLSVRTPFADIPTPSFSYIGGAHVPLRLLAGQMSYTVTVPIFCAYTMEAIGSCRVDFKCSPHSRSGVATPEVSGPIIQPQPFSSHKFAFTVTVDSVKGLTSADFTEVHAQTRLTSLVGPTPSEDTFASLPINLDEMSVAHLQLRRSLSVLVTSDMVSHLENGYATVEFFARVRNSYLERLERFDAAKEKLPDNEADKAMRSAETETPPTEHHDVLASIEVHEMGNDGEYAPADVEDDIVYLHLGVQRQLVVSLKHASGQSFKWTKIVHASASNVRLQPKDAQSVEVSDSSVDLSLVSHVDYSTDGTSKLLARGTWDSAAHHCVHLDRRSRGDDTTIVKLTFMVDVERVDEPVVFTLDLKVRIIGRDSRRSSISIRNIWRPKPTSSALALFGVDLNPPLARTARDLWRLDTSKKPVAHESVLNGWRPRSIALVAEYSDLARVRRALADVQTTRVVLDAADEEGVEATTSAEAGQKMLLERAMGFWQREIDTRVEFDVARETEHEKEVAKKLRELVPDIEPRLVPTVRLVTPNESIVKRGSLSLLRDSRTNRWEEAYAVLRPPYLHLHPEAGKKETQIINLSEATVEATPDVAQLLGRRFAFTVYTPTNSYIIQAVSQYDLEQWRMVIARQRRDG